MKQLVQKLTLVMLHMLHVSVILFCIAGWLFPALRHWHLLLCTLIALSWFGLGAWKGWGYCLITDIQWQLLRRFGMHTPPYGYVPMLLRVISGREVDAQRVDIVTQAVFYAATLLSLWSNRDWLRAML